MSKIVRFSREGRIAHGLLERELVFELFGDALGDFERGSYVGKYDELRLLSPCEPTKIVGVGLNYRSHVDERGVDVPDVPVLFLKPPSSVIGPSDSIILPLASREVVFEAELGVVMKRRARHVSVSEVQDYVLGYICANDITARDLARTDVTVTRAKCFDTFCPLGPCIATDLDTSNLMIRSWINGQKRQEASTQEMLLPASKLVSFISQVMTLESWDVILTGTPEGADRLTIGDVVEVEIEGIGKLVNGVVSDNPRM